MKMTHIYNVGREAGITRGLIASRGSLPAPTVARRKTGIVVQGVFGLFGTTVDATATDANRRPPIE
jgi:hypothetical protein